MGVVGWPLRDPLRSRGREGESRQFLLEQRPITHHIKRLHSAGLPAHHAHCRFRHAQRLGQQGHHRRIGLALVGHRADADPQHGRVVTADFDALDGIAPGIGGGANEEAQAAGAEPIAFGQRRQG